MEAIRDEPLDAPPGSEEEHLETQSLVCRACGREYRTLIMPREMPLTAQRRCIEQHILDGCAAYRPLPPNAPRSATEAES